MGSLKMTEKAPGAALPESSCAYLLQELKVPIFLSFKNASTLVPFKAKCLLNSAYGA